jgi:hypothetical protein
MCISGRRLVVIAENPPHEQECLPFRIAGYTLALGDMNDDLAGLKALYPNLSPEELVLAKENLDRYLSLAWEIYEDSLLARCEPALSSPEQHLAVTSKGKVDSQQPNYPSQI